MKELQHKQLTENWFSEYISFNFFSLSPAPEHLDLKKRASLSATDKEPDTDEEDDFIEALKDRGIIAYPQVRCSMDKPSRKDIAETFIDAYIPEANLGIELNGWPHRKVDVQRKDRMKEYDRILAGITVITMSANCSIYAGCLDQIEQYTKRRANEINALLRKALTKRNLSEIESLQIQSLFFPNTKHPIHHMLYGSGIDKELKRLAFWYGRGVA